MNIEVIIPLIVVSISILGVLVFLSIKNMAIPQFDYLHKQIKEGKTAQAIRTAKQILAKEPRNIDAHYLLARTHIQEGKREWALREYKIINGFSKFSKDCPEIPFRQEMAELYLQSNEKTEALKEFLVLTKMEPHESNNYYKVGLLFDNRNQSSRAAQFYKKAITLDPLFSDAWFAYGQSMYRTKKPSEAWKALEKVLKIQPNHFKAYFLMGCLLRDAQKHEAALEAFQKAQQDSTFKIKALIEMGGILLRLQKFQKAQEVLQRVIRLSKNNDVSSNIMHARYLLSLCYEKNRNLEGAIEQWNILHNLNENFRDVKKKIEQYQSLYLDERIKDFIIEDADKFYKTSYRLMEVLNLTVIQYRDIPDGAQITAEENNKRWWRNEKKQPVFIHIVRLIDTIDLPTIRKFHMQMQNANIHRGYFFSCSDFTQSAQDFSETRSIRLFNRKKLRQHLDLMDKIQGDDH